MVLQVLRALFVLLMGAVGWFFTGEPLGWMTMAMLVSFGVLLVCIDILSPRTKMTVFAGTFMGLLVGMLIAYALSFAIQLCVDLYGHDVPPRSREALVQFLNIVVGLVCCYLTISFILQTKDDFRFIVPYVEFSRQVRGARPLVLDTSILIDGRILEIVRSGIVDSRLIVPRFVLDELQTLADMGDRLKRGRGRRGLDVLNELQSNKKLEVILYQWTAQNTPDADGVDQKLLVLTKELGGRLMTGDSNLCKVAQVRGVDVINLNELAAALRLAAHAGEKLRLRLIKPGEEPGQGVGFLEDGTMVVVEQGRSRLNEEVDVMVTNVLQTATGRLVFGRLEDAPRPRRASER